MPGASPCGDRSAVELRPPSMEEQLEALSEKLARLAEQERKVSRRMACRSPERGTVPGPCTVALAALRC